VGVGGGSERKGHSTGALLLYNEVGVGGGGVFTVQVQYYSIKGGGHNPGLNYNEVGVTVQGNTTIRKCEGGVTVQGGNYNEVGGGGGLGRC
jgi:hypothetical protein